jgi:hypothetical protein
MATYLIDRTTIQTDPDPQTGEPVLRIQATAWGRHLAQTLGTAEHQEQGFYILPHSADLDARLCALIDTLIALRYHHPALLQLPLFAEESLS